MWVCCEAVCVSLWSVSHFKIMFFFFSFYIYKHSTRTVVRTNTFTTWVFYSSLFALFRFPFLPNPLKTFLPHTFPKQRTVLSCSSLQMPVTAQSPMVCEHKVVCLAPLLSSANKWTPLHGAVKVTYDGLKHIKCLSVSLPGVWRCVYLYYSSLKYCFFVVFCVFGCPKIRNLNSGWLWICTHANTA